MKADALRCEDEAIAVRRAIQQSGQSIRVLARRYGLNAKTVAKWKKRESPLAAPRGRRGGRSSSLSIDEESSIVAFRETSALPLDDCLYALQATIPHLTRSSLHRTLQRHGLSSAPSNQGGQKKRRNESALGDFSVYLLSVRTPDRDVFIFGASERVSKLAFARTHVCATEDAAAAFLKELIAFAPFPIRTLFTNNLVLNDQLRRAPAAAREDVFQSELFRRVCTERGVAVVAAPCVATPARRFVGEPSHAPRFQLDDARSVERLLSMSIPLLNGVRRLKVLGGRTPNQYIEARLRAESANG